MSKKVIIIDDSLISLNIIKTAFASSGWEVYGTQHAQNALNMLYDIAPDLIVTDAVMPVMGGFQFLKILRSNPKTEQIPTIVYSVLDVKHSKFYINNDKAEYYLQKSDKMDELINLASKVVEKHPLDDEYKFELLKTNIEQLNIAIQASKQEPEEEKTPVLDIDVLDGQFKEKYDFNRSDDKILSDIFSIMYPILEYNLAVISLYSFEKGEQYVYFDIRDIILSPIIQNELLHKLNAKHSFLFKKYAPNLKVITNEEEFLTKINFNFEYNDKESGKVIFYSKDKQKWMNEYNLEVLKSALANFFRARYINKSSKISKTNELSNKYFIDRLDIKPEMQTDKRMYTAVIEISNFKDLQENLPSDEVDYINSKISEKLIGFISDEEQLYKNDDDEYNLVFYAKDDTNAKQKLEWLIDLIDELKFEDYKIDAIIGVANCNLNGQFNFYEAQKCAHLALESANIQNRIVLYDAK